MRASPYTEDSLDIATHLAAKIANAQKTGHCNSDLDLTLLIERELDKYFDEGTLQFVKSVNNR